MKNYALFSKEGRFIGFTSFKPEVGLYKEIEGEFNPFEETYVGDYENGEIKKINSLTKKETKNYNPEKKWVIYESHLDDEMRELILDHYPIHKQINLITQALYENRETLNLSDNFKHMAEFIDGCLYRHKVGLKSYEELSDNGKAVFVKKNEEANYVEEFTKKVLDINH